MSVNQPAFELAKGHFQISRAMIGKALVMAASGLMLLYLTIPLVVVIVRAIDADRVVQLDQPTVAQAIQLSLVTTLISVALMTVLGTPLAYWLARDHVRGRPVIETVLDLPIVLPPAVAGIALLMTVGRRGVFGPPLAQLGINLPFTTIAVVTAQVFVAAPFFIRSAQTGFVSVPHANDAAGDLPDDGKRSRCRAGAGRRVGFDVFRVPAALEVDHSWPDCASIALVEEIRSHGLVPGSWQD